MRESACSRCSFLAESSVKETEFDYSDSEQMTCANTHLEPSTSIYNVCADYVDTVELQSDYPTLDGVRI